MEGVHWSLYLLATHFTQLSGYPVADSELIALNRTGVSVLLTHDFQDDHIAHCVIMDLLIITDK
jgi:hypothetical protein